MLRMDQVHVIRHKVLSEGRSIRQVARELGVSRNTIAKYLDSRSRYADTDGHEDGRYGKRFNRGWRN